MVGIAANGINSGPEKTRAIATPQCIESFHLFDLFFCAILPLAKRAQHGFPPSLMLGRRGKRPWTWTRAWPVVDARVW